MDIQRTRSSLLVWIGFACLTAAWVIAAPPVAAQADPTVTLTGRAAVAPIAGAAVAVLPVTTGAVGEQPLASTVTDAGGNFTVTTPALPGPVVVQVTGGVYRDPATQTQRELATPLRTALPALSANQFVAVTPLTEAATQVALAAAGGLTTTTIVSANAAAQVYLFNIDAVGTPPIDATQSGAAAAPVAAQVAGIGLATFSTFQAETGAPLTATIGVISATLQRGGTLIDGGGGFSSDPENAELNREVTLMTTAFDNFLDPTTTHQNKTSFTSAYQFYLALGYVIHPGGAQNGWSAACDAALTADFAVRDALPESWIPQAQWDSLGTWGPHPITFQAVQIPDGCDPVRWQQQRTFAVVQKVVAMDINYCHHHIPGWTAPAQQGAVCSVAKVTEPTLQGLDCSNFTSWIYNYGLGGWRMNSAIVAQSGQRATPHPQWPSLAAQNSPTAAGVLLADGDGAYISVQNQNVETNLDLLETGDLLYIMGSYPISAAHATTVTHVIYWTGQTVSEIGLANLAEPWQQYADPADWVIVDSHFAGPDYRPLHGPFEINVNNPEQAENCPNWPTDCVTYADLIWGVRRIIMRFSFMPLVHNTP